MVNSIRKGKVFEREVAQFLTDKTGVTWHRVPQSGAFATVNRSNDSRFDGDVFTENEKFKDIVIECKSNKNNIDLNALFNYNSLFWQWVKQSKTESQGKRWLLFMKLTRIGIWAVLEDITVLKDLDLSIFKLLKLRLNENGNQRSLYLIKLK